MHRDPIPSQISPSNVLLEAMITIAGETDTKHADLRLHSILHLSSRLMTREAKGVKTYGNTLDSPPAQWAEQPAEFWAEMAMEELLDALMYLTKARLMVDGCGFMTAEVAKIIVELQQALRVDVSKTKDILASVRHTPEASATLKKTS